MKIKKEKRKAKGGNSMSKEELKVLRDIKRLLTLYLVKIGASSDEIGLALNVDSSTIRRILPISKIKKSLKIKIEKENIRNE